jgi:hypothetical protein
MIFLQKLIAQGKCIITLIFHSMRKQDGQLMNGSYDKACSRHCSWTEHASRAVSLYQFQYHPLIYIQISLFAFSMRASNPDQLTSLDLITLIKLGKEYKLQGDRAKLYWNSRPTQRPEILFNQIIRKTRSHYSPCPYLSLFPRLNSVTGRYSWCSVWWQHLWSSNLNR